MKFSKGSHSSFSKALVKVTPRVFLVILSNSRKGTIQISGGTSFPTGRQCYRECILPRAPIDCCLIEGTPSVPTLED